MRNFGMAFVTSLSRSEEVNSPTALALVINRWWRRRSSRQQQRLIADRVRATPRAAVSGRWLIGCALRPLTCASRRRPAGRSNNIRSSFRHRCAVRLHRWQCNHHRRHLAHTHRRTVRRHAGSRRQHCDLGAMRPRGFLYDVAVSVLKR